MKLTINGELREIVSEPSTPCKRSAQRPKAAK
jgi:hypothetical protein